MSWSLARTYFDNILVAKGYEEWPDGFAIDNIPSNRLDKAYHISIRQFRGIRQNQSDQESEVQVEVRTFYKGYNNPKQAIDDSIYEAESLMKECVKLSNRTQTPGILNVVFNEAAVDPVAATNDNVVMVTQSYTVRIVIAV